MSKDLAVIILAAGRGTRLKSKLAKALHVISGRPLIQFSIEKALKLSPKKIVVIVGFQKDKVKSFLKKYKGINVVEQKKLIGTADAVKSAKGTLVKFSGNTLVTYVDMPLIQENTLKKLLDFHNKSLNDCTVLTAKVKNPFGFGRIIRDSSGQVCAITEQKDLRENEYAINEINTGILCFKNAILLKYIDKIKINPIKNEFYLTDIISILYQDNLRVGGFLAAEEEALGINSMPDLFYAQEAIRLKTIYNFIEKGVNIVHPKTTFIDENAIIGKETVIYPFTVIERNVKIGQNCSIGPFCHLRPGTRLKDKVQVGNFTEINRSSINTDSLVKHFSYVGDAAIGRKVNIGAGTVTANYDGAKKNKTVISDNVFIGSDSILVAPLKVGKNAVTGAGCVVTKNVEQNQTVIGVPARPLRKK